LHISAQGRQARSTRATSRERGWLEVMKVYWMIRRILEPDDGQTLVEYEMIILLVAIACIALLVVLGEYIRDTFFYVTNEIRS
jgi:Flp pilus assembly pilin Flp